ncbi:MAG TPA: hypothetical protein DEO84_01290 [candidate division Zixibacteria bacterium]|jgi:hypothetical protein|nr:hypothetical protein [candidate division Zixibacteria bacterium]HBY99929.1 hypothetical protein [candidate division Zixibacteria bacterium]
MAILIILLILSFSGAIGSELKVENYYRYAKPVTIIYTPIQRDYLKLDYVPITTGLEPFIRGPVLAYPGDYFWPPDTYLYDNYGESPIDSKLTRHEIASISEFISKNLSSGFYDSSVSYSLNGYAYDFPNGPRREAYTMLSDADTIFVISGWLDKFLSFYRVVPGDKRLTIPELMKELEKITPLSKEIDQKKFRTKSDSVNYLIEYVDKVKMFRVRNYLMKATLPPDAPDALESYHNLIEVTKFYDKEAIP